MKLYYYTDLLDDEYVVIIDSNGKERKLEREKVKELYNNDEIARLTVGESCSNCSYNAIQVIMIRGFCKE